MTKITLALLLSGFIFLTFCSDADSNISSSVTVKNAAILEVAPVQKTTAAFMKIQNDAEADDVLTGASADIAEVCELHKMVMEGEMMRMMKMDSVEIPAGKSILLKRGGLHLMLINLKREIHAGESFPLTLTFKNAGDVIVQAEVKAFDDL